MAKITANDIRLGNILEHKGGLYAVMKKSHTQPGKGGAYVQVEMKEITTGTKVNERFRSTEDVEKARLDQKEYQFLFMDGDLLTVMDLETYEQEQFNKDLIGDALPFLQDNMELTVETYEGKPVGITVPEQVVCEIVETEAVVKGQTAASSNKPAMLDNGIRVMVPPFIETGNRVVVRTEDSSYVERAKDE